MNLRNIVRNAINSVNPDQFLSIQKSLGYDNTGANVEPIYSDPVSATAQVQPITSEQVVFINNYNSSSIYRNFYINGDWSGLDRPRDRGGDIITWNNLTWLVDSVPEGFDATAGWTRVVAVAQLGAQ